MDTTEIEGRDFNVASGGPLELFARHEKQGDVVVRVAPTFDLLAYSGGVMHPTINGRPVRAVVDLAGLTVEKDSRPILRDHDSSRPIGHTNSIVNDGRTLRATGVVSHDHEHARDVVTPAKNGFPWQASIGLHILAARDVRAGEQVHVNGQTIVGPFTLVTRSQLKEISIVALGGDDSTTVSIAASSAGGSHMEQETAPNTPAIDAGADTAAAIAKPPVSLTASAAPADDLSVLRARRAADLERIAGIEAIDGIPASLAAQAIRDGWSVEKAELATLRAARPSAPSVHVHSAPEMTADVLTAGFCMAGGLSGLDKKFSEQTLTAADRAFKGGQNVSIQRVLLTAAQAGGYGGSHFDRSTSGMGDILRAAFSTRTISGVFANTANKFLLDGYNFVEQEWRKISAVRSVSDFKQITSYRLTDSLTFEEVGPDGEIKHGTLGEASFTNRLKTYAKMLGITRQDIINDDLNALTSIPQQLGRGSALKLNSVFWTAFKDSATLFSDSNSPDNLAASTLDIAGLTTVATQYRGFTDAEGNPLGATPRILLVPPALEFTALQLMNTTTLVGGSSTVLNSNPLAGRYQVVVSNYLTDTNAWYLLADPRDIPTIEVAFLNGVQTPTVETADVDFNQLGIQMRGYFDFGVATQDPRGGIKSNPS